MGGCCSSETDKHTELATASLQPYPSCSVTPPSRRSAAGHVTPIGGTGSKVVISTPPTSPPSAVHNPASGTVVTTAAAPSKSASTVRKISAQDAVVKDFLKRAAKGLPVVVLLGSGHGIECTLRVDQSRQVIVLMKNDLKRETPFRDIGRVLSTPEELARIITDAKLDDHCSAIYTPQDSSCIVFAFDTLQENVSFVQTAHRLIDTTK